MRPTPKPAGSFAALVAAIEGNDLHLVEREAARVARERIINRATMRNPKRVIKCRT
jgi:hypothetical protein